MRRTARHQLWRRLPKSKKVARSDTRRTVPKKSERQEPVHVELARNLLRAAAVFDVFAGDHGKKSVESIEARARTNAFALRNVLHYFPRSCALARASQYDYEQITSRLASGMENRHSILSTVVPAWAIS